MRIMDVPVTDVVGVQPELEEKERVEFKLSVGNLWGCGRKLWAVSPTEVGLGLTQGNTMIRNRCHP